MNNEHIRALDQALTLSTNILACVDSLLFELGQHPELSEIESNAHEAINILTRIRNDLSTPPHGNNAKASNYSAAKWARERDAIMEAEQALRRRL